MKTKKYGYRIYFRINDRVDFVEIIHDNKSIYEDENILPQMQDYMKENDLEILYLDDVNDELRYMDNWMYK